MLSNNTTSQRGVPVKRNAAVIERVIWIRAVTSGIWIGNVRNAVKGIGVIIILL